MTNLESVASEGMLFLTTKDIAEEPNLATQLNAYTKNYLALTRGEEETKDTYNILRRDLSIVPSTIDRSRKQHQETLITKVKKNARQVAQSTTEPHAIEAVEDLIGNLNYQTIKKALKEKEDVTPYFSNLHNSSLWQGIVMLATPEARTGAATAFITRTRTRELIANLYATRNSKPVFSNQKYATFIERKIKEAPSTETKNKLYETIGTAYTKTIIAKAQEQTEPQPTN